MERVYIVTRSFADKLWTLDGRLLTDGVEYRDTLSVVYPKLEDGILYARDLAEYFLHTVLCDADAEILSVVPSRYPVLAAPDSFKQRWTELVLAGKIQEAEQLCLGEWKIYTYPTIGVAFATAFVLKRPLLHFRKFYEPTKRERGVVTVVNANLAEIVRDYCYGWEVKILGEHSVSVQGSSR